MLKKFVEGLTNVFKRKPVLRLEGEQSGLKPEGEHGVRTLGHRQYVGGLWEEIGKLQLSFLMKQGLQPRHCFLDIACGSLRGGIHFINYLDVGNYLGLDKERALIEMGIEKELGREAYDLKKPEFVISKDFEFERFSKKPQFSLAQSLFTHLTAEDISLCLRNLMHYAPPGHIFFATFNEGESSANPATSHSHAGFRYSRQEMETFGERYGWKPTYIGDWEHPRNQMIMKYELI